MTYIIAHKNFLEALVDYAAWRLITCTRNCVICDEPLGYQGLKPAVCSKPLCTHGYISFKEYNCRLEEYGLGLDIAAEIHHNPEVVDMMINMTVASANVRFANSQTPLIAVLRGMFSIHSQQIFPLT